jgi:hypothetical protein
MKLLHLTVHVQYTERVEAVLADCGLSRWARYQRVGGRDSEGRHEGSQAFPGRLTVIQAQLEDDQVEAALDALETFRTSKRAHRHLEALVLPVERRIGFDPALKDEGEAGS